MRSLPPGDPARFDEGAIRVLEGKILKDLKSRKVPLSLRMKMYSLDIRLELPPPLDRDVPYIESGFRAAEKHAAEIAVHMLDLYGTVNRQAGLQPNEEIVAMVEEFRAEAQHNIPSPIDVIDVDLPRLELSESDLSQPRTEMEQHHAKEFFTPFDGVEGCVLMVKLKWIELSLIHI